jgi:Mycothiol maleylpyruvate isomerase N-terminal domain
MERQEIVEAYQPFVDALRAGGFVDPDTGWSAALVAAHVALNNDGIVAVAEAIAAGESPSYDNAEVIDDGRLRDMASAAGNLEALAALIEKSAARLAVAWELVGPEAGATEVPARIEDGGRIVLDGPIPVRTLIEVNATNHLHVHLEQLLALQRDE